MSPSSFSSPAHLVLPLEAVGTEDRPRVGGKAAALGEMIQALAGADIRVPGGFATTARAYRTFLGSRLASPLPRVRGLGGEEVDPILADAAPQDLHGLGKLVGDTPTVENALRVLLDDGDGRAAAELPLGLRAAYARLLVRATPVPSELRVAITESHRELEARYGEDLDCAVRSSATVEDSEVASFAGQYDSYLNVRGLEGILQAWRKCVASGFTERAVSYQRGRGMDPLAGAISVVVMKMVRSDLATSGVIFTLDPDSGNPNLLHVTSSYGLGELVVQGTVTPDTFLLWKEGLRRGHPSLVHRELGAKDRKLIYSTQGGTATESVDVEASRRREWSLGIDEVLELGRMALAIEDHYRRPMDIEWAKDGLTDELFVVQSRPETVHAAPSHPGVIRTFRMDPAVTKGLRRDGRLLLEGLAVGSGIGAGAVRLYRDYAEVIARKRTLRSRVGEGVDLEDLPAAGRIFDRGDVLVTEITTPDWEPLMKEASLIITERGGRTSHAAIVAREFGVPAIVGAAGATRILSPLQEVTGSCAEGDRGAVYDGIHPWEVEEIPLAEEGPSRTRIKLNVGFPGRAARDALLPCDGVGLARIEFILTAEVGVHPLALCHFSLLQNFVDTGEVPAPLEPFREALGKEDPLELRKLLGAVDRRIPGSEDPAHFFVDRLRTGVALICAAFHPRPVLVRLSDLKSNEYRDLVGGRLFEPYEENPMIGWRGASRYLDPRFAPAFELELRALREVRDGLGLDNLQLMVPFCRSPAEGEAVVERMEEAGIGPSTGTPLFLMVEIPSNVLEAEAFIDGMGLSGGSIGSNDLVQTAYAVSRDDLEGYQHPVDARSPGIRTLIRQAVGCFRARGIEIGICGQAPSDHPDEVPRFLVEAGISSISVTSDTFYRVWQAVARAEEEFA